MSDPEKNRNVANINLREATDEELEHLKTLTDDDLLRASSSLDLFAVTESMRRLKNALHSEELAIKWLTVVLVLLTLLLVWLGFVAVRQ